MFIVGTLVFIVTWIAPALFFLGIMVQTYRIAQSSAPDSDRLPSEPFVLMALGAWFLAVNGPLLQQFAVAMEYRLGTGGSAFFGDDGILYFRIAFSLAAVSVVATLAKAFWTHVQLEDNHWGAVSEYRKPIWSRGDVSKWGEYCFRCLIAVAIVLMQKKLGEMSKIPSIQDVAAYQNGKTAVSPSQEIEAEFVSSFSVWLGEFARLGFYLYVFIFIWLAIVSLAHLRDTQSDSERRRSVKKSLSGTALSTLPAFLVVWLMYYLATGGIWPVPMAEILPGVAAPWVLVASSSIFGMLTFVIIFNVTWTIIVGPMREFADLFLSVWRAFKSRRAGSASK